MFRNIFMQNLTNIEGVTDSEPFFYPEMSSAAKRESCLVSKCEEKVGM